MIAALYVQKNGCYYGLDDVDPWDIERDARTYAGPWPVVAHPPCERWSVLAPMVEKINGYKVGDDGGCFAAALHAVRTYGGVLEHPARSLAWKAFGLPRPMVTGGWYSGTCGGWSCEVMQWHYGHRAVKRTWLYAYTRDCIELPSLIQRPLPEWACPAYVTDGGGRVKRGRGTVPDPNRKRLTKKQADATPIPFRDLLLSIARSARVEVAA